MSSTVKRSEHPIPLTIPAWNPDRAFAFVRHPFSWYSSWWRYRTPKWTPLGAAPVPELLACIDDCNDDYFPSFCEKVMCYQPALVTRLYEWMIGPVGWENVKYVGRYENLHNDLAIILNLLGLDVTPDDLAGIEPFNVSQVYDDEDLQVTDSLMHRICDIERAAINRWYYGRNNPNHVTNFGPWVRSVSTTY